MRWKELLQLPVTMLPLALESAKRSSRASASKMSQRWDLMLSSTGMLKTGCLLLHMSQIFTEMRSLVTMLRVPSRNITEQYLLMISLRKLGSAASQLKVMVLLCVMDVLESLKPSEPRLVPKMNCDQECGWRCEHVILYHFYSLLWSFLDNDLMRKGWESSSKLHMKALESSVAKRNSSLRLRWMLFSERQARLGKTCFKLMETKGYSAWRCGMASSAPADRTRYFYCFSKTLQSLMELELEVSSLRYFDCGLSQLMWLMPYPMSTLRSVSNSRQCDWNSKWQSYSCCPAPYPPALKTISRPARSPSASISPEGSNLSAEMLSSSIVFSLRLWQPKSCEQWQGDLPSSSVILF